ncbi:MAG: ABC-2 transporter permease [Firmicutes bacterium]|nr:ABC-2 transporter permease [Bacillota bacterium]
MSALLLKDFYMILRYCRAFFLLIAVFFAISLVQEETVFFLIYPIILVSMIPITLLSYDERDKWDKYSSALPYTRAQLVSSKYLIGLFGGLLVLLISCLIQAVKMTKMGIFDMSYYMEICEMLFDISLMAPLLVLPFVFKFGVEKGRIVYYIVILGISIGAAALTSIELNVKSLMPDFSINYHMFTAAIIVFYIISWRLSIVFYRKRQL